MPLWRSLVLTGWVTYGSQKTGKPSRWKMLLLALAFDAAGDCDAARRAYRATAATFARRSPGDLPPRVAGYGIDEVRGLLAERLDDPELVT